MIQLPLEVRPPINAGICAILNPLFPDRKDKKEKIEEVSRYGSYAQRLIDDISLREEFYNWVFVFGNEMRPLIEFPETVRKITACGLGARIGFFGGRALQVVDGENKQLTLPFEGVPINILDEDAVVKFRNNYCLTIKEIYKIFNDRVLEMGNLEFLPSGICNWNPKKLGTYNPATDQYMCGYLEFENWWELIPWLEQVTIEEAQRRYEVPCDGTSWVFTAKASREKPTTAPEGTHTYLEVAIPNGWGYDIHYFGKFATSPFPQTTLENFNCITAVLPAAICYPDENIFNLHREHIGHSALATPVEGRNLMRSIRKDIANGMNGNLFFQLVNENCCKWVWKKLRHHLGEERIPNLFSMPFLDIEAEGGMGRFFQRLRNLPPKKQKSIMSFLFFISGGFRRRKVVKKNGSTRMIGIFYDARWKPEESFLHPPRLFSKQSLI